jgi:hypothetical protein
LRRTDRATIDRRGHERLALVEDHTSVLIQRGIRDAFFVLSAHRRCAVLSALREVATIAVPLDAEALRSSLVEIWEKTWVKCEEIGAVVVRRASGPCITRPTAFMQKICNETTVT